MPSVQDKGQVPEKNAGLTQLQARQILDINQSMGKKGQKFRQPMVLCKIQTEKPRPKRRSETRIPEGISGCIQIIP